MGYCLLGACLLFFMTAHLNDPLMDLAIAVILMSSGFKVLYEEGKESDSKLNKQLIGWSTAFIVFGCVFIAFRAVQILPEAS